MKPFFIMFFLFIGSMMKCQTLPVVDSVISMYLRDIVDGSIYVVADEKIFLKEGFRTKGMQKIDTAKLDGKRLRRKWFRRHKTFIAMVDGLTEINESDKKVWEIGVNLVRIVNFDLDELQGYFDFKLEVMSNGEIRIYNNIGDGYRYVELYPRNLSLSTIRSTTPSRPKHEGSL